MASILVVEEQRGTHELLRSALVIAGHEVVVSGTAVPSGRYDLAVVDCRGETTSSMVGEVSRCASRVVLFSDAPEDDLRARAQQAGAAGYIVRGRSARMLVEDVHRLLRP